MFVCLLRSSGRYSIGVKFAHLKNKAAWHRCLFDRHGSKLKISDSRLLKCVCDPMNGSRDRKVVLFEK